MRYLFVLTAVLFLAFGASAASVAYVVDQNGGLQQFSLPLTPSSTPNFTLAATIPDVAAVDASGNVAYGQLNGTIKFVPAPVTGSSTPTASFLTPAGAAPILAIRFNAAGDLFVAPNGTNVYRYSPPFSNASTPVQTITGGFSGARGLSFDAAGNLYISDNGSGALSRIAAFAPPYSAAPTVTPLVSGVFERNAVSGSQLFVADSTSPGRVAVYNLPVTGSSTPAFSITNGINQATATDVDASGNLLVTNYGNHSVAVYSAPYSSSSSPVTITSINPPTAALLGLAVGSGTAGGGGPTPGVPALSAVSLAILAAALALAAVRARF